MNIDGKNLLVRSKRAGKAAGLLSFTILIILIAIGCGSRSGGNQQALAAASRTMPVAVANVVREDVPVYLIGLGSINALNTVSVHSRVDGQLVDVRFHEGQTVKEGDRLAVIDPRPYEVQLAQAQAQLYKDQAAQKDAQLNYQRYRDLLQVSGAMSQQQVDTQKATADQLEGAVRTDQAAIDNAKLQLTYCHITAPITGRIGLRIIDPGNIVHAADTNPLVVITQLQPIAAIFTLPEDSLPQVAQRMHQGTLQVEAYSHDDQTKLSTGKLLTIDNLIDQTTGTGRLKAIFDNKEGTLWPNQFVNIRLLLDTRKNSLVVPSVAIQTGPQGTFVYAVKGDKTVEARPVTVALTEGTLAAISSGLNQGDQVVTDGQDKLQPGAHVEPRTSTQPANPVGARPAS
jgi:multidrug efflux system membrane fusion protein